MNTLATDSRQIILIYNSDNKKHREALSYAESSKADLRSIDLKKEQITGTIWAEIAELFNKPITGLLHTEHADFQKKYGELTSFNENDAIKILRNEPDAVVYPFAIKDNQVIEVISTSDLLTLFENDSAGIDKK